MDVVYRQRTCHNSFLERVALAVTDNPVWYEDPYGITHPDSTHRRDLNLYVNDRPTVIQLCDWFVDWIKSKEFKTSDQITKRSNIGRAIIWRVEKKGWPFRQIGRNKIG
jgi:hypothetical protein